MKEYRYKRPVYGDRDCAAWIALCDLVIGKSKTAIVQAKVRMMKRKGVMMPPEVYSQACRDKDYRHNNSFSRLYFWCGQLRDGGDMAAINRQKARDYAHEVKAYLGVKELTFRTSPKVTTTLNAFPALQERTYRTDIDG